ncbi:hypothetical protein KEM54_005660 [Ascosphaera aggregata]|nr:hypothetical protein KEM54_005660 [Ascosphaera aggregata]
MEKDEYGAASASSTSDAQAAKCEDMGGVTAPQGTHLLRVEETQHQSDASLIEGSVERAIKEEGIEIHDWYGSDDPENPSITTGVPAGSYGSGNDGMGIDFHVSNDPFPHLSWGTVSWNMGAATIPLIIVPLTESFGRMPGYFISYVILIAWMFGFAFAQNYASMVVTRGLGGGFSSACNIIISGTISDIWKGGRDRSAPTAWYVLSSCIGIALGPFVGSMIQAVHRDDSWRWIWYVQIIYNAGILPIFWVLLCETRADIILKRRAEKIRKETERKVYTRAELENTSLNEIFTLSVKRPTVMLFTEPVVSFFTLWISFAWGILFLFFSSVVITYTANYNMTTVETGLIQLAISIGSTIMFLLNPLADRLYFQSAKNNKEHPGHPLPEARLYTSIPGSILFAAGLFWYGWSSKAANHWMVPTLGIACTGMGIFSIYMAVANYLEDAYEKYASSALSAASFGRNLFGAFLPLASNAMFNNLGYGWAGTLLGVIGLALSLVPVALVWKGPAIRARSPFMREAMFTETAVELEESHRQAEAQGLV